MKRSCKFRHFADVYADSPNPLVDLSKKMTFKLTMVVSPTVFKAIISDRDVCKVSYE